MTVEDTSQDEADHPHQLDWRLMLPPFVIVCLYAASMGAVLPVLPFLLREMGATPLVIGVALGAEALGQFVAAPLIGQLSDRFGRKRVLLASQACAVASLLMLATAPNVLLVILARALFGLAAGNFSAAAAYVADNTSPDDRRQAIGMLNAGLGLGGVVGAGLSGFAADSSLAAPIYAALILSAIGMGVSALGLKDGQAAQQEMDEAEEQRISFRAIAASPVIRALVLVMLFHCFAYGMYISQLPIYLGDTFTWNGDAFGPREFSYLVAADGVINILVPLFLLRWLGARVSERNLILGIFALVSMGFLSAGLATTIPMLAFAVLCVSTGDALAKPTYVAAISVHAPQQRQGVVIGTAQSLTAVVDIVSPALGGFILGYALYGVWIGAAMSLALAGALTARCWLPANREA